MRARGKSQMQKVCVINRIVIKYGTVVGYHTYVCITPDKTMQVFRGVDKEETFDKAKSWCRLNNAYVQHQSKSFGKGSPVFLTYNDLIIINTLLPEQEVQLRSKIDFHIRKLREKEELKMMEAVNGK